LEKYTITLDYSIRDAFKQMDDGKISIVVCVDGDGTVIGVITDGDFRSAIYNGIAFDDKVEKVINRNYISVQKHFDDYEVESILNKTIVNRIPVLDDGKLVDILLEEDFVSLKKAKQKGKLDNPVVIMAGGKGTRLDPFTRILPKPLIPLGNDPVIKVVMDQFAQFGMTDFHVSLNHKGRMIKAYFHDHDLGYNISYVEESIPLGTAGALRHLEGVLKKSFFVSNCDIIVRTNYYSIHKLHRDQKNDLTLVCSMKHYTIPYGVCETDNTGRLKEILEKPKYDYLVNTGLYLMEPDVLDYIPRDVRFDMTDLIDVIKGNGLRVGVFPVSENSWIDIGQWSEYNSTISEFEKNSLGTLN
jgi:dTDP-glucose pyrophosphorylase